MSSPTIIVLELGTALIRAGFAGESSPRVIVPSILRCLGDEEERRRKGMLVCFLAKIFRDFLHIREKDCKVMHIVVIENVIEKRFERMDLLPTEIIWSILLMIISTFIFSTWYFGKKSERSYKISDAEAEEIRKRRLERLNSETVKDKEIETKKDFFRLNQPTALAEHPGIAKHDELTGVVDVETKETRSHCSQNLAVKSNIALTPNCLICGYYAGLGIRSFAQIK